MKYKFRAYNKETKTMILLDPYQWSLTALNEEENWKVMMWTGLLDRHGKEIYEGDILKDIENNNIEEVKGFDFSFGWKQHLNYKEVIGNIYQDSHILDKP